jgi:hypothetical protein
VDSLETAILNYLQAHPNAVDSERGIREWWLGRAMAPCSPAALRAAIDNLVAAGALHSLKLPDGRRAYAGSKTARP